MGVCVCVWWFRGITNNIISWNITTLVNICEKIIAYIFILGGKKTNKKSPPCIYFKGWVKPKNPEKPINDE